MKGCVGSTDGYPMVLMVTLAALYTIDRASVGYSMDKATPTAMPTILGLILVNGVYGTHSSSQSSLGYVP